LRGNYPLQKIVADSIWRFGTDTSLAKASFDKNEPFRIIIEAPHRSDYQLVLYSGAVESLFNKLEDSISFKLEVLKGEDLGSLFFKVKTDSVFAYVLEMSGEKDQALEKISFRDSTTVSLRNVIPQKLQAYLIQDHNADGQWTTGDFFTNRLPEVRIKYQDDLSLRANWELELTWQIALPENQSPGKSFGPELN
jgi:hypothetical protein